MAGSATLVHATDDDDDDDDDHDGFLSYAVNRQGLDVTLLAEPSSDEEEVTTKRKKHTVTSEPQRRRKPATTSSAVVKDKENKTDVTAPQVSASVGADTVSHAVSADSRPVRIRRKPKRLYHLLFSHHVCVLPRNAL